MQEKRTKMDEELRKLEQINAHLAALEQMASSFPKGHSTRVMIESLLLQRAREVVEEDIGTLRESLGYGTL
jgi:high-affinity nickel permease